MFHSVPRNTSAVTWSHGACSLNKHQPIHQHILNRCMYICRLQILQMSVNMYDNCMLSISTLYPCLVDVPTNVKCNHTPHNKTKIYSTSGHQIILITIGVKYELYYTTG